MASKDKLAFTFSNCLGEGGYGEVYLATQHGRIQRQVAVKVLREEYQEGSDAMNRLRDEGQALAFLAHPAIVQVHEFARIDGRLALVMEYVDGSDASYFCDPGRLLDPKVVLAVIRDVGEALNHAFTTSNPKTGRPLELIHRDVKPANIRLTRDGNVKLLDFGVAKTDQMDRRAATMMGDVLLTSGFGAPETLGFGIQSSAGDIFALGVCLYQMTTGLDFYGTTDLRVQVNLALDAEDFASHVESRLALVENNAIRALLADMFKYAHENRPNGAEVADRCDALLKALPGETIGQWARRFDWPPLPKIEAPLVGRRIDAQGIVLPASEHLPKTELFDKGYDDEDGDTDVNHVTDLKATDLKGTDIDEARPVASGPVTSMPATALPDLPIPDDAPPQGAVPLDGTPAPPPLPPKLAKNTNTLSAPAREVAPRSQPRDPVPQPEAGPPAAGGTNMALMLAVLVLVAGLAVFALGVMLILASILMT